MPDLVPPSLYLPTTTTTTLSLCEVTPTPTHAHCAPLCPDLAALQRSGQEGARCYPPFMNPHVDWAPGMDPGLPLRQQHDVDMLTADCARLLGFEGWKRVEKAMELPQPSLPPPPQPQPLPQPNPKQRAEAGTRAQGGRRGSSRGRGSRGRASGGGGAQQQAGAACWHPAHSTPPPRPCICLPPHGCRWARARLAPARVRTSTRVGSSGGVWLGWRRGQIHLMGLYGDGYGS